ncbi:MAG: phosphoglycerate dehydrogenase [Candidatus Eisenbacteria bacterium]|nr:phosphoglycerate dehydrogenase [Candidatus Eisenbacteria bacterium]
MRTPETADHVRPRILVTEPICEPGVQALRSIGEVEDGTGIERDGLLETIGGFDALVVRSHTLVDGELIERGRRLRVVGRAGVGVDNIDIPAATARGIVVVNAPEGNILSAAEHTVALMLGLSRRIAVADRVLKAGSWSDARSEGVELFGKTLGIVGLGRVGSLVAVRAEAFGMRVVAYDPYISEERFARFGTERMPSLDALMKEADYVSVHTPRTDETYGMVGSRELALARDGVRVINCARGGIVNEDALADAIESGKVAGAGVDVFDDEPVSTHPLFAFEDVVVTPHLGGTTEEAQVRVGVTVAEQVAAALEGRLPRHALNMPLTDSETVSFVEPFMPLAESMGRMYTQLFGMPTGGVEVRYGGEVGRYRTDLPTLSLLRGLLEPVEGDAVNLVNGRYLAENRGISVTESRSTESGSYASLLTVVGHDGGEHSLTGTLHGREARITGIDGFEVDLPAAGDVLVCWFGGRAVAESGIVGRVGTILGQAGVAISRMEVGREVIDGRAIMVISLAEPEPDAIRSTLSGLPGVSEVRLVRPAGGGSSGERRPGR